ncbi:sigma-70 family RNA polymerase sigma factor [Nocardioides sp. LS1]|uniref:sigma-70 family RNA polymerase sigma factor n=1 Tax=Nocardioides sp. LS1 TaxID=1027620 RepID=UPI000F62651A|nr:sigma-70 family RNA polymerase sigma factor [Nocardioides sp. LS1]GCD92191.1 hypothetical protein NLS1_41970 [Nocardioides sp. LS1]
MRNPDQFDAFYKDARSRLLLQTYALTGDLGASRSAVRDSFVVAWHHWRKITRQPDPETWARPHAWAHAQRRHTARIWHREKGLDPEVKATLDALGKLPVTQRKALLLNHLTNLPMGEMAREIGLPLDEAERTLQTAAAQFAVHRDVLTTGIQPLFEPLREHVEDTRWPRATIIRRAGAARRRTHTAVGAALAVAVLIVSGSLITDTAGVHPTLSRDGAGLTDATFDHPAASPDAPRAEVPQEALLTADEVGSFAHSRHWKVTSTDDNTAGDGIVLPCQQERYADPKGTAALFRRFEAPGRGKAPGSTAGQEAEVSATVDRAKAAYDSALGWYAGCTDERAQLLSTRRVGRVGDEAMLFVLRDWDAPVTTTVVGVARTGVLTTTTLTSVPGDATPDFGASARMLATAVGGLCHLPGGGACAEVGPKLEVVAPLPVGQVQAMLGEVDLPPVNGIDKPWVGTEPRKAVSNAASTGCDQTDFNSAGISNNVTRTFLVPGTKLADAFGLTETVGSLPERRAKAFVEQVRTRLAACHDKNLGTDVTRIAQATTKRQDLTVWRVTTELSDKSKVDFFMGIARDGTSVAQVGFVPDGRATMPPATFVNLVRRALERLPELPAPKS